MGRVWIRYTCPECGSDCETSAETATVYIDTADWSFKAGFACGNCQMPIYQRIPDGSKAALIATVSDLAVWSPHQ